MGSRRRARPWREVKAITLATVNGIAGDQVEVVTALLSGLSSLLHIGLHFAFFPDQDKQPTAADFVNCTFIVLGWTADERGHRAQLASEPITGADPLQAPDGWAGRTELDQLELQATIDAFGFSGDWRAIAVLEPADGCIDHETFENLVKEVALTAGTARPVALGGET
jgi:hypothetical protein